MEYEEVILRGKRIKKSKDICFDDIEPVNFSGADILFEKGHSALYGAFRVPIDFKDKIVGLSSNVDWVLREYDGCLFLIALKKDC